MFVSFHLQWTGAYKSLITSLAMKLHFQVSVCHFWVHESNVHLHLDCYYYANIKIYIDTSVVTFRSKNWKGAFPMDQIPSKNKSYTVSGLLALSSYLKHYNGDHCQKLILLIKYLYIVWHIPRTEIVTFMLGVEVVQSRI